MHSASYPELLKLFQPRLGMLEHNAYPISKRSDTSCHVDHTRSGRLIITPGSTDPSNDLVHMSRPPSTTGIISAEWHRCLIVPRYSN